MIGARIYVGELVDDPQIVAGKFFTEIDHPVAGRLTYPGVMIRYMVESSSYVNCE